MPGWKVNFEPTITHLTPTTGGAHTAVVAAAGAKVTPPTGSFPVVTAVRLKFTDDAAGPDPVPRGPGKAASLDLIARAASADPKTAPPFVVVATMPGTATFDGTPKFTIKTIKDPASFSVNLDVRPGTANEVVRSDWVLQIDPHPTFVTSPKTFFTLRLPWKFDETTAKLQLNARLSIDGTLHADESRNLMLDIPLSHRDVPEEADKKKPVQKFFGLRNLYTRANDLDPKAKTEPAVPKVAFAGRRMRVLLDSTFVSFCTGNTSAKVADVVTGVTSIMNDAGFGTVDVLSGAATNTECRTHWKQVGGHFMSVAIRDADQGKPEADRIENKFAASIDGGGSVAIPDGMEERIPFFDFYIFAEDKDPPNAVELAHSERRVNVKGSVGGIIASSATKVLHTPIIISKGSGSSSPLRNLLSQIDKADHANLLAGTICHEIGHTFGLKHPVVFSGSPPYVFGDAQFGRGTMSGGGIVVGSGTPRMPLYFFGPIHQLEIRRLYL
jgi:hypothetical protein